MLFRRRGLLARLAVERDEFRAHFRFIRGELDAELARSRWGGVRRRALAVVVERGYLRSVHLGVVVGRLRGLTLARGRVVSDPRRRSKHDCVDF